MPGFAVTLKCQHLVHNIWLSFNISTELPQRPIYFGHSLTEGIAAAKYLFGSTLILVQILTCVVLKFLGDGRRGRRGKECWSAFQVSSFIEDPPIYFR